MRNPYPPAEQVTASLPETATGTPSGDAPSHHVILRDCFELFQTTCTGLAKLSIETSNDLFEMDPRVTPEEVHEFKSKRNEWVQKFDVSLRELFEKRLSGQRRKGRRPDPLESFESLRVMNDVDTTKQGALDKARQRLEAAAKQELQALDYRVSVLFGDPPGSEVDNPFAPAYLLDAIGMTSRALYSEARIWRPLMERVVGDFVPAINKTYIQLNRFLAELRVLPEIGATLRARSDLRPADDGQLLPLFSRLFNDVHPSMQAWRTLDPFAAGTVKYDLAPLAVNPYATAAESVPKRATDGSEGGFPRVDAMLVTGAMSGVLETLDHWQRLDPMTEHLRTSAPEGIDAGVTPVNRIPWIHAAIAAQVTDEGGRTAIDVVGFLFDYIFRDTSIPPRFRMILGELQIPVLKVALADRGFFADKDHPARRLVDGLAGAAVGADEDEAYGKAFESLATSLVDAIRVKFVLDMEVLERACAFLKEFTDHWKKQIATATQRHVDAGLTGEWHDAHRSRVRVLIRGKLAGADVPGDVRGFISTVWAEYLVLLRQARGTQDDSYTAAVKTMDDMLWSIASKGRKGQKARLSKMIPALVSSLRAGGAAVQVTEEKMTRFLTALYDLHIAAIRPEAATAGATSTRVVSLFANRQTVNVHDFVADLIEGTWLAFDRDGIHVHARLSWISPWRATYIFSTPSGSTVMVFTPEDLAWSMSTGKVTLVLEPVPLFDRAVSATLEYLARHNAPRDARRSADGSGSQTVGVSVGAVI